MWYATLRDAILTCAQKLTGVSLICCMETTTKKWKTEKLKKAQICSEVTVNSLGNHVVSPEEEKGYNGKDLQKRKVLSLE